MKRMSGGNDALRIRDVLLEFTLSRLKSGANPDSLTAREIASGANCAVGLISYHFGGKDNLVREAAKRLLYEATEGYFEASVNTDDQTSKADVSGDWDAFIASMARVSDAIVALGPLGDYIVRQTLLTDDFSVAEMILPTLRARIGSCGGTPISEPTLRIRALHFILGLQAMFVRRESIPAFASVDIGDSVARRAAIADLAESLVR